MKAKSYEIAILVSLALGLPLAAWSYSAQRAAPLQAEAAEIFDYDRAHPNELPAHRVRALSLAVAFMDAEGARKIIAELGELRR